MDFQSDLGGGVALKINILLLLIYKLFVICGPLHICLALCLKNITLRKVKSIQEVTGCYGTLGVTTSRKHHLETPFPRFLPEAPRVCLLTGTLSWRTIFPLFCLLSPIFPLNEITFFFFLIMPELGMIRKAMFYLELLGFLFGSSVNM